MDHVTTSLQRDAGLRMTDETGVRFGLASGTLVLALLVAGALPLDLVETALVALAAAVAASATLPWAFGFALGGEAWAFYTGFFEHREGLLTFAGHDLLNLLGFVALTALLAGLVRAQSRHERG